MLHTFLEIRIEFIHSAVEIRFELIVIHDTNCRKYVSFLECHTSLVLCTRFSVGLFRVLSCISVLSPDRSDVHRGHSDDTGERVTDSEWDKPCVTVHGPFPFSGSSSILNLHSPIKRLIQVLYVYFITEWCRR